MILVQVVLVLNIRLWAAQKHFAIGMVKDHITLILIHILTRDFVVITDMDIVDMKLVL